MGLTTDPGGRRHDRRGNPGLRVVPLVEEHAVEPAHEPLERRVFNEDAHDDGVAGQGADPLTPGDCPIDQLDQQGPAGLLTPFVCLRGDERVLEDGQLVLGDRDDDLVLGLVLVVDGGLGHPDGVSDHLQRGAADAVGADEVQGGGQDALLRTSPHDRAEWPVNQFILGPHPARLVEAVSCTPRQALRR